MRAIIFIAVLGLLSTQAAIAAGPETSCIACHADPDVFEENHLIEIPALWSEGVHAAVGISCHDCHGGNPEMDLAEDMDAAMDPGFADHPFEDVPDLQDIPGFCGRCHSDPNYMKQYRPDARVDQEREYRTSFHGIGLEAGNERVATCVSCHGVHGILKADNPRSPVYPTKVAETCGACHANPEWMAESTLPDGRPLPVDQVARWKQSVHAHALLEKGDLFAPTCNDCHGNHGASPPGLESVIFVCGQCHGREAELFRASPKHAGFLRHNEYLADAGDEGCASCHDPSEPQSQMIGMTSLGECTACHQNHAILRPTTAMFSSLPETPCALCHGSGDKVSSPVEEPPVKLANFQERRDVLLAEAATLGLTGEARYDWMVDQALELPAHTNVVEDDGEERIVSRPEFGRLFEKFRVGKTRHAFLDPMTGEEGEIRVRRCSDCHAAEPELADEPVGLNLASEVLRRLQELETLTARGERILLTAKRGGIEVGEAQNELHQAIDSQIQLQALVHAFSTDEGGLFVEVHDEGIAHASAALTSSSNALEELGVRRQGLIVLLVIIAFVLLGLGLAIRKQSLKNEEEPASRAG